MPVMSRPRPPTPDHAGHDVLLVAQLAAGDPLPADERGRAMALVGSCAGCASLAADLGAVSPARAAAGAPAWGGGEIEAVPQAAREADEEAVPEAIGETDQTRSAGWREGA